MHVLSLLRHDDIYVMIVACSNSMCLPPHNKPLLTSSTVRLLPINHPPSSCRYRHIQCQVDTCGVYLLHAGDFETWGGTKNRCWTLWIQNEAFWYDEAPAKSGFQYFDANGVEDKFRIDGDRIWRHFAYVFDEADDKVKVYMDGTMVFESDWGGPIESVDCVGPGKRWAFGRSHPGYTYGGEVEFADLRMYHHGLSLNRPGPLAAAQIYALSKESTVGRLDENHKCLSITDPLLADSIWQNSFGHGCDWFFKKRQVNPAICALKKAAQECPISCKSKQECFARSVPKKRHFVWDRTQLITMNSKNGTICLGGHLTRLEVVNSCMKWVSNGGKGSLGGRGMSPEDDAFLKGWLESASGADGPIITNQPKQGRRVNITLCSQLENAIDEHCGFDIDTVKSFTKEMKANGGDFTVAFWYVLPDLLALPHTSLNAA